MHAVSVSKAITEIHYLQKQLIQDCVVILCCFFVLSDWDGIMERDNQQDGEAEGVKICDPPSGSDPPGKLFNCSLKQL